MLLFVVVCLFVCLFVIIIVVVVIASMRCSIPSEKSTLCSQEPDDGDTKFVIIVQPLVETGSLKDEIHHRREREVWTLCGYIQY